MTANGLPARMRARLEERRFRRRWGFDPPPAWSDWVGYEVLLEEIEANSLERVEGDVLEIGALLGGGTAKLCRWFEIHARAKRVVAVDVFDPSFDVTETVAGWPMGALYAQAIGDRDQRQIFDEVTNACGNLVVAAGDSTSVDLQTDRLAFAFVDGNHSPSYVRSDFDRVWERLSPRGIVAFHDYGGDLPGVTQTLHRTIGEHADGIARLWTRAPTLLFLQRATDGPPGS